MLHASGHDAAPGEDEADLGRARGQADVHRQRQGGAEADGRAVDGGDHGLLHVEDPQRDEPAAVVVVLRALGAAQAAGERLAPAAKVGAGAEGAAGAGDDHRPHAVVAVGPIESLDQLADHRGVDGVEAVRPVERDRGHPVGHVVERSVSNVIRSRAPGDRRPRRRRPAPAPPPPSLSSFWSAGITSVAKRRIFRSASS